jgi:hypothetical protein
VFSGGFKVLYHREDIFAKEFLARDYRCLMEIKQLSPAIENGLSIPSVCCSTGFRNWYFVSWHYPRDVHSLPFIPLMPVSSLATSH